MYLLMMSLLLCRQRGEGVRKLAKSCRRHLWTAPYQFIIERPSTKYVHSQCAVCTLYSCPGSMKKHYVINVNQSFD